MSEIIRSIEQAQLRSDLPSFNVGDTVRVQVKVVEGSRERLQAFEGTVIAKRNGSSRETFTVRRVSYGIGVERTFPLHSPRVDSVQVIRRGKVRRARVNLRDGGAWWAAVYGVAQSRTQLSDFTFTFHFHALEKEMATHSSVLAWRIPGTGEPGGLLSMGSHRVGHD